MVVKKNKTKTKPRPDAGGDTPITVGGGGDGKIPADVTIDFEPGSWTQTSGLLTLKGGKVKTVSVTFDGVNFQQLPVKGTFSLTVICKKP